MEQIQDQLRSFRESLQADGYDLCVDGLESGRLYVTIVALEGACEECLVPPPIMERILLDQVSSLGIFGVDLTYPGE
jgi:Fe-S cluster biogenesis protein NfuA